MKNIVVVSKEIFPNENANTNCMTIILDEFLSRGYSVTVLSFDYDDSFPKYENHNGYDIYRVHLTEQLKIDRIFGKKHSNILLEYLNLFFGKIAYLYIEYLKLHRLKKLYKKLKAKKQFEYIFSVMMPEDNHKLSFRLADKNTKWIMYNLDPLVYNATKPKNRKNLYNKWVKRASAVIETEGIVDEYKNHNYFPYKHTRLLTVPLPNLMIDNDECVCGNQTKKTLLYTGCFYEKIRNPQKLVEILGFLDSEKFDMRFYGSCCGYLSENFGNLPECVRLMGTVSNDECKKLTQNADVLVNVGNTVTNQIPSKVFEYIATGKPILNIYYSEKDPSLKYLKKYPEILNIKCDEKLDDEKISLIADFLSDAEITPKDELKKIYSDCLSENVVNDIVEFIEKI